MNEKVTAYIQASKWQQELNYLRTTILECDLTETYKWSAPCYTFQHNNIVMVGGLKSHCLISFFKGALLSDGDGILVKPGENSRSSRVVRFTNIEQIIKLRKVLQRYIFEAVEVHRAGLKITPPKQDEQSVPYELTQKFAELPALKKAFETLTPGRQRGYLIYFSGAKKSASRSSRIEKYIPRILDGKGFHDCVCGMSRKLPTCDGSHKYLAVN